MKKDIPLAIAQAARLIPDEKFDIDHWKCETVYCAIGNAIELGLVPGLILTKNQGLLTEYFPASLDGGEKRFAAIGKALGITLHEAEYLFAPAEYPYQPPTQDEVATRIESFAQDRIPEGQDGDV